MVLFRERSNRGWLAKIPTLGRTTLTYLILLIPLISGCTSAPNTVTAVKEFDINRYKGIWYEIMRLDHSFERGLSNVTANYGLRKDGTISVLNRGFNRKECRWEEAKGSARFQGDKKVASLSVTFFWPFSGGYHVFELGEQYNYALVAGPSLDYLWLLGRKPTLNKEVKDKLISKARISGFPVDNLILVDHSKILCKGNR
tara:strand:- start:465 stop:1064 length:600 start_codon:yes stop_codon:yes gene_type:complete